MKPPAGLIVAGGALVLLPAMITVAWIRHMARRHGAGPLLWRYFSGAPLDGQHRTNRTWTRRATKVLHPTGNAVAWHHMPRWSQAATRTAVPLVLVAILLGLFKARSITLAALAAMAVLLLIAGTIWAVRRIRAWQHYRHYVQPLHRSLTAELGVPPPMLAVEADRSSVTIGLDAGFTPTDKDKEAITRAVTAKLAIEAPDPTWRLHGRNPQVTFAASQPPPPSVSLLTIRKDIEAAQWHQFALGIGRRAEHIVISVDNDSPHVGVSMGSGDGKSVLARNFLAQALHHGWLGVVLDYKLISHQWARDLPNVAYAGLPAEIHVMAMWLAEEIARRNLVALAGADIEGKVHADVGPPLLVVCEELNATQNRLAAYWKRELDGKGRSPASEALDEAMFTGRQVRVHLLQIGQRLSAKAAGSGDARENLGVKILCDPSAATWRMLCEGLVQPPAAGHRGRYQVVTRREVREVQGALLTGKQARELALSGTVALPRRDMPFVTGVLDPARALPVGADLGNVPGTGPDVLGPPGSVTLSEAIDAGVLKCSKAAARKAAQRPGFPAPLPVRRGNANLYDVADLHVWAARKVKI